MNNLDIIKEFLVESHENLDRLDRDLVALEKDPRDRERLASIFRTIHTIKGTCGFLSFAKLGAVTHVGENLLSRLRDGRLLLNAEITSALLALVDAVREMLARIESTGQEGVSDYATLIDTVTRLSGGTGASTAPTAQAAAPTPPDPPAASTAPAAEASNEALQSQGGTRTSAVSDSNIRVDVDLLDKLMTLVGELVLARNRLLQLTSAQKDNAFLSTCQRLNLITTELQEGVMKTRMQPIANIWNKFPRLARDLALACSKQVRLGMEGKETELDKTIIEAIKDPLTHLVRNAIDHGIEVPEVRQARGKPAEGHLFLRAFHEGGQVNLSIADDGGGIDTQRIKQRALERALITREQAAHMTDRELLHLVYLPGFSTAEQITNVSGRGVGMDVVKTNIEKIGGTVDIQSQPGQGTTVKIKIPLTLAIIPALILTNGGDRYAIPQVSLLELIRLEGERARRGIENIHGTPVYRLRGSLLPLVYLDRELNRGMESIPFYAQKDAINIVVLRADDRPFGLVVEGISDTQEIVVKPLGKHLKGIPLFAGAAIMGDGRVALILDVLGLAQSAGVVSEVRNRTPADKTAKSSEHANARQTLLLLGLDPEHRLAIPLSLVTRLEEIPLSAVEKTAHQEVVQYRGRILPLVWLATLLNTEPWLGDDSEAAARKDPLQVVVYSERERSVGLVVDRILDTVETAALVEHCGKRPGILGSAVIGQRVTDLLDLPGILRAGGPSFFEPLAAVEGSA